MGLDCQRGEGGGEGVGSEPPGAPGYPWRDPWGLGMPLARKSTLKPRYAGVVDFTVRCSAPSIQACVEGRHSPGSRAKEARHNYSAGR